MMANESSAVGKSVAIFSGKGGVGKSTIVSALAVASSAKAIDADPQCSLAMWGDRRQDNIVTAAPMNRIPALLDQAENFVFVDMPGTLVPGALGVLQKADLILTPTTVDQPELDVLPQVLEVLALAGRPSALVINRLHPRSSAEEAIDLLRETNLPICPTPIRERVVHRQQWVEGLTAIDVRGPARDEILELWTWVQGLLNG